MGCSPWGNELLTTERLWVNTHTHTVLKDIKVKLREQFILKRRFNMQIDSNHPSMERCFCNYLFKLFF